MLVKQMADTYTASKQINQQLSNINAGGQALGTVYSLSTFKLLSHFDDNVPANIKAAQAKVTNNKLAYLRAGMLGVRILSNSVTELVETFKVQWRWPTY
jgi:hypothetical protein